MARVLVTGGTGFVASHCLIQLLAAGHETRTTVRNLGRENDLRAMLRKGGADDIAGRLTVFAADLNADPGWAEAAAGCDYVLHVASPFPSTVPRNENELIVPARDGALRVLRAARDGDVKRVVLTSSFAAIGYGANGRTAVFHGRGLDEPQRSERSTVSEIEDDRRTRSLGFHGARRRQSGIGGGQSGRRFRASPGTGLLDLDPAREAFAGWLRTGLPRSLVWHRRCA